MCACILLESRNNYGVDPGYLVVYVFDWSFFFKWFCSQYQTIFLVFHFLVLVYFWIVTDWMLWPVFQNVFIFSLPGLFRIYCEYMW